MKVFSIILMCASLFGCSGATPTVEVTHVSDSGADSASSGDADKGPCTSGTLSCNGTQPQMCTGSSAWQNVGAPCSGTTPVCQKGACLGLDASIAGADNNCLIGGKTYADNEPNPTNACQICTFNTSNTSWSNITGLAPKINTTALCSSDQVCYKGQCSDGCYINGSYYNLFQVNPANPCESCTLRNNNAWTPWVYSLDGDVTISCADSGP